MTDPPVPTLPSGIVRALLICGLVSGMTAAVAVALAFSGIVPPAPIWSIVFIGLGITFLALLAYGCTRMTIGHMDVISRGASDRMNRRLDLIGGAMAEHGTTLDEIAVHTGEIPRIRPQVVIACPHPHAAAFEAEVLPAPATVAAMKRLAHKITD